MVNDGNKRGFNQMANRQRFKPGSGKQQQLPMNVRNMGAMLFDANQLGDNPGFLDFNDDSTSFGMNGAGNSNNGDSTDLTGDMNGLDSSQNGHNGNGNRRMNPSLKRPLKNTGNTGMRPRMNNGTNRAGNWVGPMGPPNVFSGPPRRGPMHAPPVSPPSFRGSGHSMGMRMRGPQNNRFGCGPPGPMSLLSMNPAIPPPIPPMGGQPMAPPLGMGRMMHPPHRHDGPMRRYGNGHFQARGMGPRMNNFVRDGARPNATFPMGANGNRPHPKQSNKEEYPLDKAWVTDEIRVEHQKKTDLVNRLKGHRDDALFAQFKVQRDKFVKMYETARLEFIGKHPEQDVDKILTETVCKKPRIENDTNTSATKTEAPASDGCVASATATSSHYSTDSTESATPSATCTNIASSAANATTSTIDTNECTEITSTSAIAATATDKLTESAAVEASGTEGTIA
ncbi:DNA-binding protein K10 [Anopheles bellator]|uniref:DNA-binding protein K10 n=1 Tax=Anopheles bellator TaxID=139047 RepID=UPI002648B86E|nr:DNA-binding protein K10 [Anopheles bellator]